MRDRGNPRLLPSPPRFPSLAPRHIVPARTSLGPSLTREEAIESTVPHDLVAP